MSANIDETKTERTSLLNPPFNNLAYPILPLFPTYELIPVPFGPYIEKINNRSLGEVAA
jgi:hypothetical protein